MYSIASCTLTLQVLADQELGMPAVPKEERSVSAAGPVSTLQEHRMALGHCGQHGGDHASVSTEAG